MECTSFDEFINDDILGLMFDICIESDECVSTCNLCLICKKWDFVIHRIVGNITLHEYKLKQLLKSFINLDIPYISIIIFHQMGTGASYSYYNWNKSGAKLTENNIM